MNKYYGHQYKGNQGAKETHQFHILVKEFVICFEMVCACLNLTVNHFYTLAIESSSGIRLLYLPSILKAR